MGCSHSQGYHLGRRLAGAAPEEWTARREAGEIDLGRHRDAPRDARSATRPGHEQPLAGDGFALGAQSAAPVRARGRRAPGPGADHRVRPASRRTSRRARRAELLVCAPLGHHRLAMWRGELAPVAAGATLRHRSACSFQSRRAALRGAGSVVGARSRRHEPPCQSGRRCLRCPDQEEASCVNSSIRGLQAAPRVVAPRAGEPVDSVSSAVACDAAGP